MEIQLSLILDGGRRVSIQTLSGTADIEESPVPLNGFVLLFNRKSLDYANNCGIVIMNYYATTTIA